MDFSIVIPVFNEKDSIAPLCKSIVEAVEPLGCSFESLLVDDGSTDGTFDEALRIANQDSRFRVVKLNKNFGQTPALKAGFELARGEIIVTMDGDLQNDPRDIGKFIRKVQEGYDLVVGWRKNRQDARLSRTIPSRIANKLIRIVTGVPLKDNGCALRAYRAEILRQFPLYSEMHRLLPTMLALAGARLAEIEVAHHPRKFGHSKYGLSRIYKVLFDLVALKTVLTLFRIPLSGFGITGIFFAFLSFIVFLICLAQFVLVGETPIVIPMGVGLLLGSLSVFMFMLGLIADIVYKLGYFKIDRLMKPESL